MAVYAETGTNRGVLMITTLAWLCTSVWAFGPDPVTTIVGDETWVTPYGSGIALLDVNGDGYDDAVLGYVGGVDVHFGGPSGASAVPDWSMPVPAVVPGIGMTVADAGDINGDGFDDLAVAVASPFGTDSIVELWLGSPTGLGFVPDASLLGPAGEGRFGEAMVAEDLNGDGFSDLVVLTPGRRGRVEVFRGGLSGLDPVSRVLGRSGPVVLEPGISAGITTAMATSTCWLPPRGTGRPR